MEPQTNFPSDDSELNIVANGVGLLLIAPDGRETGYDPESKKEYQAIPDSEYSADALAADDGSGEVNPSTTQTINVRQPISGKYRLEVSAGGLAEGEAYKIRASLYLRDGNEVPEVSLTGAAMPSVPDVYEFQLSTDPRSSLTISRALSSEARVLVPKNLATWPSMKSQFGWEVSYPYGSSRSGGGQSADVTFPGPCYSGSVRCARVNIQSLEMPAGQDSARAFLLAQPRSEQKIISQGEIEVDGKRGYEVTVVPDTRGWIPADRRAFEFVAVQQGNRVLEVAYSETDDQMRGIRSPAEWKFHDTFQQILSTITFFH
jgi:hypothetical protein